jgi:phosphoribosylformimino-5-aminoimidazole carboxamide ribotide isomerase
MELIPAIDLMQGRVVRLTRGDPKSATIYGEDPLAVARQWEVAGADAIHVVDLDAALGITTGAQLDLILRMAEAARIPIQVGGGIRTMDQVSDVLSSGVHKVVVGTMAFKDQAALREALFKFGAGRIVVALDYGDGQVKIKGWQEATSIEPLEALDRLRYLGVRQFLMTAIAQDGTLAGPDLDMLKAAAGLGGTNIYASGGITTADDVRQLGQIGVKGFIVGKALYEGTVTMDALRLAIADGGWRMAD